MIEINELGRIDRFVLGSNFENPRRLAVPSFNDPFTDPKYLKYLIEYDSAQLRFPPFFATIKLNYIKFIYLIINIFYNLGLNFTKKLIFDNYKVWHL